MTPALHYPPHDDMLEDASWNHSVDDEMTRYFKRKQRVADVQGRYNRLASKAPFLQQKRQANVAYFHRSEIQTGQLLGKGGFAHVYEITGFDLPVTKSANQTEYTRLRQAMAAEPHKYVLKQIKPRVKDFVAATADMAMEAALLSRLDPHPNCISLKALPSQWLKACDDEDGFFLILEKVDTTLEAELKAWDTSITAGELPSEQVRFRYAQEMAQVLHHLHQQGLVYRDMKPDNVGLQKQDDGTYTVKLFDFGLSRGLPDGESSPDLFTMSCVGTPRYAAPEVLSMMITSTKKGLYNHKVDVYGWAVVVWQLFSLHRPKDHSTPNQWNLKPVPEALRSILVHSWRESIDKRSNFTTILEQLEHTDDDPNPRRPLGSRLSKMLRRRSVATAA